MKSLLLAVFATVALLALPVSLRAADAPASTDDPQAEFKPIFEKIVAKVNAGKHKESDLTDETKALDALIAKHKGEKTDGAAYLILMKAQLYIQVFHKMDEARKLITLLKTDYPDTKFGMAAGRMLAELDMEDARQKEIQAMIGKPFDNFEETDLDGKPLSPANFKGKVVLIDFWATWCKPCVEEMPNVIGVYNKYHDKGFEIIGVSLDQEKTPLVSFIKDNKMPWPQFFDEGGWDNKLAKKYNIHVVPSNFLLDQNGKILGVNLMGDELDEAVAKALEADQSKPAKTAKNKSK